MKAELLIVDDEVRDEDSLVEELRDAEYRVFLEQDVDHALNFVTAHYRYIDLLVLDIMMPPGLNFRDVDTKYGSRTGVQFYRQVRTMAPTLPIIMLTNVTDENVARSFLQEENCWFRRKEDYLPDEFVKEVGRVLEAIRAPQR